MTARKGQALDEWIAEFKRRWGLTPERVRELTEACVPKPPPDAPPPPKPHTETEKEDETP